MFDCDIESYRDIERHCRIHSLFKLLVNRILPGLVFKNVQTLQRFEHISKTLQGLKGFKRKKAYAGMISPGPEILERFEYFESF